MNVGGIWGEMKSELQLCRWEWMWLFCWFILLTGYHVWIISCSIRSNSKCSSWGSPIAARIFVSIFENVSSSKLDKTCAGKKLLLFQQYLPCCWPPYLCHWTYLDENIGWGGTNSLELLILLINFLSASLKIA